MLACNETGRWRSLDACLHQVHGAQNPLHHLLLHCLVPKRQSRHVAVSCCPHRLNGQQGWIRCNQISVWGPRRGHQSHALRVQWGVGVMARSCISPSWHGIRSMGTGMCAPSSPPASPLSATRSWRYQPAAAACVAWTPATACLGPTARQAALRPAHQPRRATHGGPCPLQGGRWEGASHSHAQRGLESAPSSRMDARGTRFTFRLPGFASLGLGPASCTGRRLVESCRQRSWCKDTGRT